VTIDLTDNEGNNGATINFGSGAGCRNWTITSSHNNLSRFTLRDVKEASCDLLRITGGDDNVLDGLTLTNTLPDTEQGGAHRLEISGGAGDSLSFRTPASAQVLVGGANVVRNSVLSGGAGRLGEFGVSVESLSFARLDYNVIENNRVGGIRVLGQATAEAQYNWIRSNQPTQGSTSTSGILVTPTDTINSGTLIARRNLIEDNGRGLRLRCRANVSVDGVVSRDNGSTGLALTSTDDDLCPPATNQRPTAVVKSSSVSNNQFDGLVAEGRIFPGVGVDKSSFGESASHSTSPGRNAFTKNNLTLVNNRRNFNNSSGKDSGTFGPQQLRAVNNQWQNGGTAASCTGSCLCGGSNVCGPNCSAPICLLDIWNDQQGATTVFGPPMMYRASAPVATEVYPSVGEAIGSLQWIIGANFNAIEGEAAGGNTCNPTSGNCVELWLDSSGALATVTPLADGPDFIVVRMPINCNQPTEYRINKLDPAGGEYPSDAVATWCMTP
jgi:hypothetical protein